MYCKFAFELSQSSYVSLSERGGRAVAVGGRIRLVRRKGDIFIRFVFSYEKVRKISPPKVVVVVVSITLIQPFFFHSVVVVYYSSLTARKCDGDSVIMVCCSLPSFLSFFVLCLLNSLLYSGPPPHSALTSFASDLSTASLTSMSLKTSPRPPQFSSSRSATAVT